jgi:hypothetical protein
MKVNVVFEKISASVTYFFLLLQMFWNENIWSGSSTGEQASKKQKHCNGLQSLIDLVSEANHSFSWGWLVVLAEVVIENPQTINKNNFSVLLQLLADFQVSTFPCINVS